MSRMICPNCGRRATFTEREAEWTERHGLDCGPYEHVQQRWLTCNQCGAATDEQEINRLFARGLDNESKHV